MTFIPVPTLDHVPIMHDTGPENKIVTDLYSAHPYPDPISHPNTKRPQSPELMAPVWWPENGKKEGTILVAGCGTNQAAEIAYQNPDWFVTGIDLSPVSLAHEEKLASKYNIKNLQLHQMALQDAHLFNEKFDMIISTGVLHHTADPDHALKILESVLKDDGVMNLMMYGKYGRTGLYMIQEAARNLKLNYKENGLLQLRLLLSTLSPAHPESRVQPFLEKISDAELADRYLHPRDQAYSIDSLFDWFEKADLQFAGWTFPSRIEPVARIGNKNPLLAELTTLEDKKRWATAEQIFADIGMHEFWVVKKSRKEAARYNIDSAKARSLAPRLRPWVKQVNQDGKTSLLVPEALPFTLDNQQKIHIFKLINGRNTLSFIAKKCNIPLSGLKAILRPAWQIGIIDLIKPRKV